MRMTIIEHWGESIADAFHRLRSVSADQVALRVTVAVSALGACGLSRMWTDTMIGPAFLVVSVVCALAAAWLPNGPVPLLAFTAIGLWWLVGGSGARLWEPGIVAVLLAVAHLGCAACAIGPAHAPLTRRARIAVWRRIGGFVGVVAAAATLVGLVSTIPATIVPRGLAWSVAALVLVLTGAWAALRRSQ